MAKSRKEKEGLVQSYSEKAKLAKSMVFVSFKGLKVKDAVAFRKKCRESGGEYMVVKKTLMNIALKEAGLSFDTASMAGDVGTVFGFEDEIMAPRTVKEFSKTNEALSPIAGVLENTLIDKSKVIALSQLPTKKELFSRLVGSLNSPITGFVRALSGNLRGLVQVLKAVSEKKV